MTTITIELGPGPDGQPVGHLTGKVFNSSSFIGWLELIRLLDDELASATPDPDEAASGAP